MVTELEKLKTIKDKLGDKAAMEVAEAMFGAEAGRPAMILAEQGMAGFRAAQERMAQQASLQQRIERTTASSRNTIEALGGSMENLGAALAGPVVQALHPLINGLNTATGWLTEFAESNPRATKALGFWCWAWARRSAPSSRSAWPCPSAACSLRASRFFAHDAHRRRRGLAAACAAGLCWARWAWPGLQSSRWAAPC